MLCPYTRPSDKPCAGSACAAWSPEYIQGHGVGQRLGYCGLAPTAHRFTDPARARPITSALAVEALGNGARIERLNWAGDPSPKGLKQSYGLMVNYLYDLDKLDDNRAQLVKGRIAASRAVKSLMN